jgi:hypothetical protein
LTFGINRDEAWAWRNDRGQAILCRNVLLRV